MKFLRIAVFAICSLLAFGSVEAQHHSNSRPNYGGGKHSKPHGGHYQGQQNSHHKGGHYKNPRTSNQYGHHKPGYASIAFESTTVIDKSNTRVTIVDRCTGIVING